MVNEKSLKPLSYVKKKQLTQVYKYAFPCSQCLHCRINQSRMWKNRILLEAKSVKKAYFVTLTYNDEHLPYDKDKQQILRKTDLQKYLKRLRKRHEPNKLRYFAVGEYGDSSWRPHYHLAIFTDQRIHKKCFESAWKDTDHNPIGFVYVGDISEGSASYIAGYLQKKATKSYYLNLGTRPQEFATMSRHNGGIGSKAIWLVANEYCKKKLFPEEIIDALGYGKSKMPLGRYLTKELSSALGIKEKEFVKRFYNHLQELDQEFDMDSDTFFLDMLDKFKGKRDSQRTKTTLKKAKRTF